MSSLLYKFKSLELHLLFLFIVVPWYRSFASAQVIQPTCKSTCGSVSIPYPFGTTADCHLKFYEQFYIRCNDSSGSPRAFLGESDTEVINISLDGQLRVYTPISSDCYDKQGNEHFTSWNTVVPFMISHLGNKLIAVGCDTLGQISSGKITTGCKSECPRDIIEHYYGSCTGVGCCQTTIPQYRSEYDVAAFSFRKHVDVLDFNPCSYAFVAEENYFNFSQGDLFNLRNVTLVPTILDWAIGETSCELLTNSPYYACQNNSECVNAVSGPGYRCSCLTGYQGNPYMPNGCTDIDECADPELNQCRQICKNTLGGYDCLCQDGYKGDGRKTGEGCERIQQQGMFRKRPGIAAGLLGFLIVGFWLYWGCSKRKHLRLKQKFFEQNGGMLLRQELSKQEGYSDTARIYTANELKQATNNFDESRIIGRGGFGTVYKGIQDDNKVIAIKKSRVMSQNQIEQFINEVIVLSQINHRNVVGLLGCCLETEVPLLVYEYISNGTLSEHVHDKKNPSLVLSWEMRLRIAAEIAGVLAYLHSEASVRIIHRDIKSTNILLDEKYTAKVSDFGASRLVPMDLDQLSTMVQGTFGYLDPEYFKTSQLTEKSDVYSFGVVLVELMTGKKAIDFDRPEEERNLANLFNQSMKTDTLYALIDDGLSNHENKRQIKEAACLARACLRSNGEERPTMREVASELQGLLFLGKQSWIGTKAAYEESDHLLSGHHLLPDGFDLSDSDMFVTVPR